MAHRRKSSHPVCKTRRNLELSVQDVNDDDDDDSDVIDSTQPRDHLVINHGSTSVSLDTDDEDGQQIVLPSDLFKDFEAIRNQTKLDATNLMRRLLKDYQSISTVGGDKQSDDNTDSDIHGSQTIQATTSIAKDVSLATTRIDTDDDQYQGLDLSVGTRKISSQLFDTKSLNSEHFEQPLDLTCTKTPTTKDSLNRESPSSSQLDISSVNNEFNYVYVYPGLYPPSSGVLSNDEMDTDGQNQNVSPVPELLSPGKLVSPDSMSRAQFVSTSDIPETIYAGAQSRYRDYSTPVQRQTSPASPLPKLSPHNIKQEPGEISFRMSDGQNNNFRSSQPPGSTPTTSKAGRKEGKKSSEMKVISENITDDVYTSVLKLPWSRRTRTKKPKHKVKLEDTLIPQFMLEQEKSGNEFSDWNPSQVSPSSNSSEHNAPISKTPECSESVMMVYPSGGTSAYGKPVRKRGRPPKLPMLAKLLQNQQAGKKSKQMKQSEDMQAQITQQVQANGGMVVYNAGGQIMTAFGGGGIPVQVSQASVCTDEQQLSTPVMPNMAQAQFIGQIPLSQITGGPIQFLGQFPAQALPFPGQLLQTVPTATSDGQIQLQPQSQIQPLPAADDQIRNISTDGAKEGDTLSSVKCDTVPQVNYQYAFQPMFIPAGALPVPVPPPVTPIPTPANDVPHDGKEDTPQKSDSNTTSDTASVVKMNQGVSTHVMKLEGSNTISTMSTTSISNTGSGAIYQEMILSSKSLVDVKKRRRQTAIQMLKSKSGDQNFLCTSFRIRPRLVAQAQAQKERQAAKGFKEEYLDDEMEFSDSKNLICPQNDTVHFGETNGSDPCDVDFANIQIKQEIDTDDDLYEKVKEIENKYAEPEQKAANEDCSEKTEKPAMKRYMLKGSQKRKAKFYGSRIVNDAGDIAAMNGVEQITNMNKSSDADSSDMFQELFNCKVCNKIISVNDMEAHSLEHMNKNFQCQKCGQGYNESQLSADDAPKCPNCNEDIIKIETLELRDATFACDECPETFKSLPEFYEHKSEHQNKQNAQGGFECDFCGKVYQYYHALQFHRRTHRERKVPCLDKSCEMKFRSRKEMELHFDTKHPEKKEYFHCVYEGCTKKFLKNFHLQEHIRVKHYNIKAFQCPWPGCLKEFAARGHLKIHLLIHRDEKPMKCDHCDYRCRQRSAMNWHMRKHPDVPYKYKRATKSPSVSKSESE